MYTYSPYKLNLIYFIPSQLTLYDTSTALDVSLNPAPSSGYFSNFDNVFEFSSNTGVVDKEIFSLFAIKGATYWISTTSYFSPYLGLYDNNGLQMTGFTVAEEVSYTTTDLPNFIAPYTGIYYVDAGWVQGSYYDDVQLIIREDVDTATQADQLDAAVLKSTLDFVNPTISLWETSHAGIKITFNESIQIGTGNVYIYKYLGSSQYLDVTDATQFSISGSTLSILPSGGFDYSSKYYVSLPAGLVTDLSGNAFMGTATSYSFTTLSPPDSTPALSGTKANLVSGTEDTDYFLPATDLLQGYTGGEGRVLSVKDLTALNGVVHDEGNGTYKITPISNYNGAIGLSYTVSDDAGRTILAEQSFSLAPVNDAPILSNAVPDQKAYSKIAYKWIVPDLTFVDPDIGDKIALTASLQDGSKLPSWLSFDTTTNTFVGTPEDASAGNYQIKIIATDKTDLVTSTIFSLNVQYWIPITIPISNQKYTGNYSNENIVGRSVSDFIDGGYGNDILSGFNGNDTLVGGIGNDILDGGADNDTIKGGEGNDDLTGGIGKDKLIGGDGDDTYHLAVETDAKGNAVIDKITESAGSASGTDTVLSDITYTLAKNVENLTLNTGAGAINGTGNKSANTIIGNESVNSLDGKEGIDILTGNNGADIFVFSTKLTTKKIDGVITATNVDTITDFVSGTDDINLSKKIFKAYTSVADLTDTDLASFDSTAGGTALTAADTTSRHFLYDTGTGNLYYDADGSGSKVAVQFATLTGHPTLAATDLHIV